MQLHACVQISVRLLSQLLNQRPLSSQIKQIHTQIITQGLKLSNHSLTDSLIHCYLHLNNLRAARSLFDVYPMNSPPTLIWNLMIRAYSKLQHCSESITLFQRMLTGPAVPDKYTYTFVLTSCAHQNEVVVFGRVVHGMVIKNGALVNAYVGNSLIGVYGAFALVGQAHQVFEEMSHRDVFSWTSLVRAYSKYGNMKKAIEMFGEMPVRNDVSWTVMISGFVSCGRYIEALEYFDKMLSEVEPNEAVLVSALSASAHLGSLSHGKRIHDYIKKNSSLQTPNIITTLIDMYAKCGKIESAYRVFNRFPGNSVNVYTSMISGLSIHGLGKEAICMFKQMLAENLKPNSITVLGVLNGSSHAGLLQQGSLIFYNMEKLWGIVPKIKHYGCYIDLLGRSGFLAKAFGIVRSMTVPPDAVLWRSLLSASRIHRNAHFGERIMKYLQQLEPESCSGGVLLSNLYASEAKWEELVRLRKKMGKQKNQEDIGWSWIE